MSRLIDADELANKVADLYTEGEEATEADKVVNDVIDIIDNAPTVDVETQLLGAELHGIKIGYEEAQKKLIQQQGDITEEQAIDKLHETGWLPRHDKEMTERPHGEWIVDENGFSKDFRKCSNCNEDAEWLDSGSPFLSNFCPNCGADMRGERQ